MGEDEKTRLSILAKLSNLSVKFGKRKARDSGRKKWLEVRRDLEALCGAAREDDLERMLKAMESEISAREGAPQPSGEMTMVKRRRS
ncbi:MAG: hypothetical protein AB1529_07185 [Candidatus Micrarchaeota archaeon]